MSEKIKTKSVGLGIADVEKDFILSEKPMSRLVFHAKIHNKGIRGKIIRQRRETNTDKWIPEKTINIRELEKNESICLDMNTEAINNLYSAILKLARILREYGVEYGENEYLIVDPNSVIITEDNKVEYIRKIQEAGYSNDFWKSLTESDPDLATKMSYAKIIADRKVVLEEFKDSLNKDYQESYWQKFFYKNQWIFGYGLKYQFLHLITDQPSYIGASYTGTGDQRGDFLMNSKAEKRFTVLVEIKKPDTSLVKSEEYRSGTWKLENELLWATSQVQMNCSSWFREGSVRDETRDSLEVQNIFTYEPKGILVIGNTNQLNNRDKLYTFESFRRNLHNPEIITFDELFERAKFIVEQNDTY